MEDSSEIADLMTGTEALTGSTFILQLPETP